MIKSGDEISETDVSSEKYEMDMYGFVSFSSVADYIAYSENSGNLKPQRTFTSK